MIPGIEPRCHTHVTTPAMEYDHGMVLSILGRLYDPKVVSYRDYRKAYVKARKDGLRVHLFERCELGLYEPDHLSVK